MDTKMEMMNETNAPWEAMEPMLRGRHGRTIGHCEEGESFASLLEYPSPDEMIAEEWAKTEESREAFEAWLDAQP